MDIWDLESRMSHVTSGSRETLEDLEMLPLEQSSHGAYRGSLDVLGLEVPSMELWDEQCGPNDGFGFCGGITGFIPPKKWKEEDESSSSGVHCEEGDHLTHRVAPPSLTRVKSIDDCKAVESAPKHRRYRKRTKHGRYATADNIAFDPTSPIECPSTSQMTLLGPKDELATRRHTIMSQPLSRITQADNYDKGSTTNLFECGQSHDSDGVSVGSGGGSSHSQQGAGNGAMHYRGVTESLFPYGNGMTVRSSSCDELSPRDKPLTVRSSVRSTSQVLYMEPAPLADHANRKCGRSSYKQRLALLATGSWLRKSQEFLAGRNKSQTHDSVNAYVPDDPSDLKGMTNVKVIAIQVYKAQGVHELSFKKGQKLKLKAPSMDGNQAFGWKRSSRFSTKKYGYFPLSHVKLYEKE